MILKQKRSTSQFFELRIRHCGMYTTRPAFYARHELQAPRHGPPPRRHDDIDQPQQPVFFKLFARVTGSLLCIWFWLFNFHLLNFIAYHLTFIMLLFWRRRPSYDITNYLHNHVQTTLTSLKVLLLSNIFTHSQYFWFERSLRILLTSLLTAAIR